MKPLLATLLLVLPTTSVLADFSGDYAPENWTFHTDDNGSVDTASAPVSVFLRGSDNGLPCGDLFESPKITTYEITAACDGSVSFDWKWDTSDWIEGDPGGYTFNNTFTQITDNNGSDEQDGHVDIVNIMANDIFGFAVLSQDNACSPAVLEILNFVGPDCANTSISITIDIKPGSDSNPINRRSKKGVVPVAILGTEEFDVTTVDVTTLDFEGSLPAHDLTDPFIYADHLQDVNLDGETDLVVHFPVQDTGLTTASTEGCITATDMDGIALENGCDIVNVIKD